MSTELVDYRLKITRRTYQVLSAISHSSGRDMSEIGRSVLDGWSDKRVDEAETVLRLARGEGNQRGGRPS